MRKVWLFTACILLSLLAAPALAQVTNVSSQWVSGNLVWYDKAGNIIATFDGANRKITIASGAVLDASAATGSLTFASGEIVAADIATDAVGSDEIATSAVGTAEINNGVIINEDISASAAIARSKLAEDALVPLWLTLGDIKTSTGVTLPAAADDGELGVLVAANVVTIDGDAADNETESATAVLSFRLPENYVAAGDVNVAFRVALIESGAAATDNGSSIDLTCYEQADGAVGGDLVTTAAQTFAATDTWYTKTFAVTATNLVAGDQVNCVVASSTIENNAGAETITMRMDLPKILVDVKG